MSGPEPAGAAAVTGSTCNQSANTRISTTAHTNSGITVMDNPPTEIARSRSRPWCRAATTPPRMPSGTTSTNASSASFTEFASAVHSMLATGRRNAYDVPRSPWATPPIQSPYWATIGRSVPSSSIELRDRTLVGERAEDPAPHVPGQHVRARRRR